MIDGSNIQHKAVHTGGEPGFAFEAGQRVPSVAPEIYFDEPMATGADLDLEPFVDFLLLGTKTREDIADKVLFLAFLMPGVARRPRTFTELGLWMNVSGTTAKARLEAKKPIFIEEFHTLLGQTTINED